MEKEKNKPKKSFRAGGMKATVWANKLEKGEVLSVVLKRSYMDKEGEWQETDSLHLNDVAKAMLVLGKAYEYMISGDQEEKTEN